MPALPCLALLVLDSRFHSLFRCIFVITVNSIDLYCCSFVLLFIAVCMPPASQANGKWSPQKSNYGIGETVWLQCLTGYELADQKISSVTCGKDTQWGTPGPTCQGKARLPG